MDERVKMGKRGMSTSRVLGIASVLVVIGLCAQVASAYEIFCGKKANCYELLGVERGAELRDIKRAYRKLSLELHPDKNPREDAAERFRAVARAHEVLSSAESRVEYDDFLDHPEKYYWYFLEHMTADYAPQVSVHAALGGIFLILGCLHWFNLKANYRRKVLLVRQSEQYKEQIQLAIDSGVATSVSEAEKLVQVKGLHAPTWKDSLPVLLLMLPIHILKNVWWLVHWLVAYRILKVDYTQEDKEYLVKQRMRVMTDGQWDNIPLSLRQELVERRVWEEKAWQEYLQEMRIQRNRKGKDAVRKRYA
ncbi:Chaperone protein dnaJ 50 [Porphyridium purpureum]|uniref:Chaperone protein dnaJ 50 n=1 Tax=Porphyridium purpureum TaxID=35688 RepID=A0A5J4Z9U7_PORPP|nr:Chaperone protein dnaJ 50 [Porphyridium purpureum]|eukprot:POR4431..scf295_1